MHKAVSGTVLTLLIFGALVILTLHVQPAWAQGTIYIRNDGSINPPTAPITTVDKVTYVLTADINGSIVVERNNIVLEGAGFVTEGNGTDNGIALIGRSNVTISDMIVENFHNGIYLNGSASNNLYANNVTGNEDGIGLDYFCNYNVLSRNSVTDNFKGVWLTFSVNNTLSDNEVNDNGNGIELWFSHKNSLTYNNVTTSNFEGLHMWNSSDNRISHNNMLNNTLQIYSSGSNNTWNDGYPSGGNYWSDYTGVDLHSGPYQNETGKDGIGDVPYVIDGNNKDNYPFMRPRYATANIVASNVTPAKTVVGQGYAVRINATIQNQGADEETFDVTAYANTTAVGQRPVTLIGHMSVTITFTWNTTAFAKSNYTISAYAMPVQGETNITDNTFTDGVVLITIVGDINGDGRVDMKDIGYVARCFGRVLSNPNWDPNVDIDDTGRIDMKDIAVPARHFGERYP